MKWLLVLCAGLASLLALAPVQGAPAEGASTTGVNVISIGTDVHASFTVHDYGSDSLDSGNFNYHNFITGVHYTVDVACVEVSGNRAIMAFVIPEGPGVGQAKIVEVFDNGEPSAGPPPDLYGDTPGGSTLSSACSFVNSGSIFGFNQPVTAGNVQVYS